MEQQWAGSHAQGTSERGRSLGGSASSNNSDKKRTIIIKSGIQGRASWAASPEGTLSVLNRSES